MLCIMYVYYVIVYCNFFNKNIVPSNKCFVRFINLKNMYDAFSKHSVR